jgi:hypothetical protein
MRQTRTRLTLAGALAWLLAAALSAHAEPGVPAEPVTDPGDYVVPGRPGDPPWGLTFYTVWLSEEQLGDVLLFQSSLEDSQLWVAALSRRMLSLNEFLDVEVEGQVAKHAGPLQRHWEVNGLGTLRWKRFPWSERVGTTIASGVGLSYAFDDPEFEQQAHETSNKWLVYIMVELSVFMPSLPEWALVARVHHRSAAYGTFQDDLEGASNSAGLGIKFRF